MIACKFWFRIAVVSGLLAIGATSAAESAADEWAQQVARATELAARACDA